MQFSKKVKTIRGDNGQNFFIPQDFFQENGIHHETSCVYTTRQNRLVEHKHQHILNVTRTLRFKLSFLSNIGKSVWRQRSISLTGFRRRSTMVKLLLKRYLVRHPRLAIFALLVAWHMPIISITKGTNLLHEAGSASFLGIQLRKRDGHYLI